MKHSNEYLYGEGVQVPSLDTKAILERIKLLEDNVSKLLEEDYMTRDLDRIRAIDKAIKFWTDIGEQNV